jgi:RimJ/RimL family protein N-acetyltransferase
MRIKFSPVTLENRGDLDEIDPGEPQRQWVHSAWYWHQQSIENPNIIFRLVHLDALESAVGMVAFGPAYEDEKLTHQMDGAYEIIHLVMDYRHQKQGIGQLVARSVIHMLAAHPDCERILVAHHPDNIASRSLFIKLGFKPVDLRNYDGDPMLELLKSSITQNP